MSRPEVAAEPSLDDILASIRKIISEEPAAARPLPDLKALGPNSPLASPSPASPGDLHPAGSVSTSLASALNGSAVTPLSDARKPLPLDDDLSDLLEEAPATPLRPAVPRGPVAGSTAPTAEPVAVAEPAPVAPVPTPTPPPSAEPRLVVRHRPFGDEQRPSPFSSHGEAPLPAGPDRSATAFGALRPASDLASDAGSRSTAPAPVAAPPMQAAATPSLDAFASFLRNRPTFSEAQRDAEPPQLEAAAPEPAAPVVADQSGPRDAADVQPHNAGAFDLGAFVPGRFAPVSFVTGNDVARPDTIPTDTHASDARATGAVASETGAGEYGAIETGAIEYGAIEPGATAPGHAAVALPDEPADVVEPAADLVQSLRRPRPVFDAETFRWSGPSLVAAPSPPRAAQAPAVESWQPAAPALAPAADTGPASTEPAGYEIIASMPVRVPEAPSEASASDAETAGASPVLIALSEVPPVDEAAVRESSVAAANALGALAAGLAASAQAFANNAPSSEPQGAASPALAMPPQVEAEAATSELAGVEPVEVYSAEPEPAAMEGVSYPVAPLSVAVEPQRFEPGIDATAEMAPPQAVLSSASADAQSAPAPSMTGVTVLDTPAPVAAPASPPPVLAPSPPSLPAEAAVPPAAALVPHAGGLAHAAEDLGTVRTLEDTVSELLRPMLRQWLDENMPRIVEKALKIEVADRAFPPKH